MQNLSASSKTYLGSRNHTTSILYIYIYIYYIYIYIYIYIYVYISLQLSWGELAFHFQCKTLFTIMRYIDAMTKYNSSSRL